MTIDAPSSYDFIVTGASGNVGRHLVPLLSQRGKRLLVVGRNVQKLHAIFRDLGDNVTVANYRELSQLRACETLIYLAVRNNDRPGSLSDFAAVNVNFSTYVAREFARMNGKRFLNISSILSLEDGVSSPYAVSKAMGYSKIRDEIGEQLDNIYIGYFYDHGYFGEKLSLIRAFGPTIGGILFAIFKTLKPATSAGSLIDYIIDPTPSSLSPEILTDDISLSFLYRSTTRAMDLIVALGILLFLSPVFILLCVAIRLDTPGPAIFAQRRVGASQLPFTLYKFRTMKRDTVSAGTHDVSASAVTKVGAFLRRNKLDELPQAINLLLGNMTLVGPRPCLYSQSELVEARQALGVYGLKPGITGYAQIREIDMSHPHALAQCDYRYMKLQSLILNVRIIIATALGRGAGDRVAEVDKT